MASILGAVLSIKCPQRAGSFFSCFVGVGGADELPPFGDGIGSEQFHAD